MLNIYCYYICCIFRVYIKTSIERVYSYLHVPKTEIPIPKTLAILSDCFDLFSFVPHALQQYLFNIVSGTTFIRSPFPYIAKQKAKLMLPQNINTISAYLIAIFEPPRKARKKHSIPNILIAFNDT